MSPLPSNKQFTDAQRMVSLMAAANLIDTTGKMGNRLMPLRPSTTSNVIPDSVSVASGNATPTLGSDSVNVKGEGLNTGGRSASSRSASAGGAETIVTIARLLEVPGALSGTLEVYIPPTRTGDEGVSVDRFFVLADNVICMFVSRLSTGKPLGTFDLSALELRASEDDGDLSMVLSGRSGSISRSWHLKAKTLTMKKLWIEVIRHAIETCRSAPSIVDSDTIHTTSSSSGGLQSMGWQSDPSPHMARSLTIQPTEKRRPFVHDHHQGNMKLLNRLLEQQQQNEALRVTEPFIAGERKNSDILPSDGPNSATSENNLYSPIALHFQREEESVHSGDSNEPTLPNGGKQGRARRIKTAIMGLL